MTRKLKFPPGGREKRPSLKTYRENWRKRMEGARQALQSAARHLLGNHLLNNQGLIYLLVFFLFLASGAGGYYLARRTLYQAELAKGEAMALEGEGAAEFETPALGGEKEDHVQAGEVMADEGVADHDGATPREGPAAQDIPLSAPGAGVDGDGGKGLGGEEDVSLASVPAGLPGKPISPVVAPVSARFGWRLHPVLADWRHHPGVDLAAPMETPVQAVLDGLVKDIYQDQFLGQVLVLGHGPDYETRYGHCQEVLVEVGRRVSQGEVIATVGKAGYDDTSHLHFELRHNGQALDPGEYLPLES